MLTKIYQIKETCPMWDDGTGTKYERLLPQLLNTKEDAEKYKLDLYLLTCEKNTCLEFEVIELELSDNYIEDIYEMHYRFEDVTLLEKCGSYINEDDGDII